MHDEWEAAPIGRTVYELLGATFFGLCVVLLTAHTFLALAWVGSVGAFLGGWRFMRWTGEYGYGPVGVNLSEWEDEGRYFGESWADDDHA